VNPLPTLVYHPARAAFMHNPETIVKVLGASHLIILQAGRYSSYASLLMPLTTTLRKRLRPCARGGLGSAPRKLYAKPRYAVAVVDVLAWWVDTLGRPVEPVLLGSKASALVDAGYEYALPPGGFERFSEERTMDYGL
jgi:hypothetical protein